MDQIKKVDIEVKKINKEGRKQRKEESNKKNNCRKKGMNYGRLRIETKLKRN